MELTIEQALQQGIAAYKEGKLQDAERLYRAILQSQPLHPDANHNLGVLAVSVNKADAALPLFKAAVEANPKIEQFWLSYIDALIKEKQFDNAKIVLEQAKKQGVTLDKLDILGAQLASINKPENVNSASPSQSQLNTLLEHYQNGQFGDAEKLAVTITQEFPKHQFAWKVLGAILGQTGRKSEAVDANQKAVALSPQDAGAHSNLGITLKELGRFDEALASYTQAIALKPDFAEAHSNLGNTLKEMGRLEDAQASYKQALVLKPNFAEAHSNLGFTLNAMGSRESALKHFERSLQLKRGINPVDLHHKSFRQISNAKLDHDIEQFHYIAASGIDIKKFQELAMLYQTVKSEINHTLDTDILHLSDKHQRLLGDTYNRPIHILEAPLH